MIDHALLGLLRQRPDCGYRLRRRLERQMGTAWGLNPGQVYVALKRLADRGCIVPTADPEVGGNPGRQRWAITPQGQEMLETWLGRPPSVTRPPRDELLVRLLVLLPEQRGRALPQIERLRASSASLRSRLAAEAHQLDPASRTDAVRRLGLRAALAYVDAQLSWLDECRALVAPGAGH